MDHNSNLVKQLTSQAVALFEILNGSQSYLTAVSSNRFPVPGRGYMPCLCWSIERRPPSLLCPGLADHLSSMFGNDFRSALHLSELKLKKERRAMTPSDTIFIPC